MSHITAIRLINYLSFRETICRLSPFTLIVGANNTGKSNLLRAVKMVGSNPGKLPPQMVQAIRHHQCSADVPVLVDAVWDDGCISQSTMVGEASQTQEAGESRLHFLFENGVPQSGSKFRYASPDLEIFNFDPALIGGPEGGVGQPSISRNGQGVSWTLDKWNSGARPLRERFERVITDLRRCVPEIERISFYDVEAGTRAIQVEQAGLPDPVPLSEVSDGTRIVLALLTLLNVEAPPPVLLLEDIDRGLHPRLYEQLVDFLRGIAAEGRAQILATTHNPYLIDEFKDTPEAVVVVEKKDGASTLSNLDERLAVIREPGEELEIPLGQVWFSGLVGGVPRPKLPEILQHLAK